MTVPKPEWADATDYDGVGYMGEWFIVQMTKRNSMWGDFGEAYMRKRGPLGWHALTGRHVGKRSYSPATREEHEQALQMLRLFGVYPVP